MGFGNERYAVDPRYFIKGSPGGVNGADWSPALSGYGGPVRTYPEMTQLEGQDHHGIQPFVGLGSMSPINTPAQVRRGVPSSPKVWNS